MKLLDKFRKKDNSLEEVCVNSEVISKPNADTMVVILFDKTNIDTKVLETAMIKKFGEEVLVQVDDNQSLITHWRLQIQGIEFICSYMSFPFPKEEANISDLLNFNYNISEDEKIAFINQKSFCIITQLGDGKTLEKKQKICLLISKLCGSLLEVDGAIGIYYSLASLLIGKTVYLKNVEIIEEQNEKTEYFPAILWVLVFCSYTEDGSLTVETFGLEQFGFLELVFYKPTQELGQAYEKLYIMSILQITGKELYKHMDTISFAENEFSIFKQSGKKLVVIGGI